VFTLWHVTHHNFRAARTVKLARYLSDLGYGTKRELERMLVSRQITLADGTVLKDSAQDAPPHDQLRVMGVPLDPPPGAVILLHKPAGMVCSTEDSNPLVYDLLPSRFRDRSPIMSPVGRLDRDTTGLLLVTDDGQLLHRLTSPKSHLPKRYVAQLAEPLRESAVAEFTSGTLMLSGETSPLAPATLDIIGPRLASVTITEGRYHQVRRMFAAVGNHVQSLHRDAFGPLTLDGVPEGEWRVLSSEERDSLEQALRTARLTRASPRAP
jgi:16S rRNA pseudouridine516 synthase